MNVKLHIDALALSAPWYHQEIVKETESDKELTSTKVLEALKSGQNTQKIIAKSIPVAQRRRITQHSKMVINASLDQLDLSSVEYAVFSSRHGESIQTNKLADCVNQQEAVSPIVFSQSVHNTSAGLYSIFKQCKKPTTSIAPGRNTLSVALLEAASFILKSRKSQVLIVVSDQEFNSALSDDIGENSIDYAFALVVSGEDTSSENITLSFENKNQNSDTVLDELTPESLQFLPWWLSGNQNPLVTKGLNTRVVWSKN